MQPKIWLAFWAERPSLFTEVIAEDQSQRMVTIPYSCVPLQYLTVCPEATWISVRAWMCDLSSAHEGFLELLTPMDTATMEQ